MTDQQVLGKSLQELRFSSFNDWPGRGATGIINKYVHWSFFGNSLGKVPGSFQVVKINGVITMYLPEGIIKLGDGNLKVLFIPCE